MLASNSPENRILHHKKPAHLATGCGFTTPLETNKHDHILFSFAWIPCFNSRINQLLIELDDEYSRIT